MRAGSLVDIGFVGNEHQLTVALAQEDLVLSLNINSEWELFLRGHQDFDLGGPVLGGPALGDREARAVDCGDLSRYGVTRSFNKQACFRIQFALQLA